MKNELFSSISSGYFRSAKRFYNAKNSHQHDVKFAAKALGIPANDKHLEHNSGTTYERHPSIILQYPGFRKFDQKAKRVAENEAEALNKKIMAPFSLHVSGRFLKIEKVRKKAKNNCYYLNFARKYFSA